MSRRHKAVMRAPDFGQPAKHIDEVDDIERGDRL